MEKSATEKNSISEKSCNPQGYRIEEHPVLDFNSESSAHQRRIVSFTFNDATLYGYEGEPIIVSLRANGILKLKEGAKQHTPFGAYCMQGRCCSCSMTVNDNPNVMTCVTYLEAGMRINYPDSKLDVEAFKRLPSKQIDISPCGFEQETPVCDLAIIGAGPAGMEAAIMAAESGVKNIVIFDDKNYLGGQLALQTHTFFGNQELGAGVRGNEMGRQLARQLETLPIDIRLNSTVVGLYPKNMLAFRDENRLNFVTAKKIICATGASERFLPFTGNYLPGVMGAGGAQTFMNIYGVRPGKRVLIVGGGNIGVILAYQLIQAGVEVAAVIEAASKMGAYEVHVNKIKNLKVPIFTRHTIIKAHGEQRVEGATIAEIADSSSVTAVNIVPGSERYFEVDTICLAVGLAPLNELLWQAGIEFSFYPELGEVPSFDKFRQTSNKDILVAGDCAVIGEASIARLEGRIAGLKAALDLGHPHPHFNEHIDKAFALLSNIQSGSFGSKLGIGKSKVNGIPAANFAIQPFHQTISAKDFKGKEKKVLIDCPQDIPCNPCETSCRAFNAIKIGGEINQPPSISHENCHGCGLCLKACPGRAIRLVQYNYSDTLSAITTPYEFTPYPTLHLAVEVVNKQGENITTGEIVEVKPPKNKTECGTITFTVPKVHAFTSTTISIINRPISDTRISSGTSINMANTTSNTNNNEQDLKHSYVCRCEEVSYQDIITLIEQGYTTVNDIRRLKRVGMGQCRGLSCSGVIENILKRTLKKAPEEILFVKKNRPTIFRPPIKRITLGEAARLKFTAQEIQLFENIEKKRTIPQEIVNTYIEQNYTLSKEVRQAKYVIIGGGANGVFTAWWLARLGASDIVVIEKNFLTSGQTGACLGGVRTGFNTANKVARATKGLQTFANAKNLIGQDIGWFQGGYVYLAFDKKQDQDFKDSINTWENAKVPFSYHTNHNEFHKFVPGIDASKVYSLVHFPEAGGANPFRTIYMFAEDAKKMGVKFLVDHEVVGINVGKSKDSRYTKACEGVVVYNKKDNLHFVINSENVIAAPGTASVQVAKMAGIDLSNQLWIDRHGAFITEKMPLWLDPLVVSYHPTLSGYWQQKHMEAGVNEGELVACYSSSKVIKGFNTHSYIYFLSRMAKSILLCQPGLSNLGIIRNYAEHYVGRESGVPIIGETPVKGFWTNIGQKGHGFMCSPGDGWALARSILDGQRHEWISECTIEENLAFKETMR